MPPLRALRLFLGTVFFLIVGASLSAHALHFTRLSLSPAAGAPEEVELRVQTDLAAPLVSPEEAASLPTAAASIQAPRLTSLAGEVLASLSPRFLPTVESWRLESWSFPELPPEQARASGEPAQIAWVWRARLPSLPTDGKISLRIVSRPDARVVFPVACSVTLPDDDRALTHWLQNPGDSTHPLAWSAPAASMNTSGTGRGTVTETTHPGWLATSAQYLWQGFLHILPLGVDHILFVLGLYFLGTGWRALAAQVGTFTLAHTTTLGLAAAGIVRVSPAIVEPLIALSISFVALENIFRPRVGAGRLVTVFAFGLLHGLGFAGALSELELPRDQFFTALLAFNFGVDFGQLAVLALAFLTVGWFRARPWYRGAIAIPACALIAATGLYWTVERALF